MPRNKWPPAEVDTPTLDEVHEWIFDSVAEATDGCDVEADGICSHGHPSWLLRLGLV